MIFVILQFQSLLSLLDFAIIAGSENCKPHFLHLKQPNIMLPDDTELAVPHFGVAVRACHTS